MIAAYVDGVPLPAEQVFDRLEVMRRGPAAALLPDRSTAEGRQLVRWLTQIAVTEQVLCDEAARRGLGSADAPWPLDPTSRVQLGSGLAAALTGSPVARAAAQAITADAVAAPEPPDEDGVQVLRWVTSSSAAGPDNGGRPWPLEVDALPPEARARIAAAGIGETVVCGPVSYSLGDWAAPLPRPETPYDPVAAARNVALLRWVDERIAAVVTLEPGFEHPGDISQPDHTHRH
jgi:[acyl-carrier-protein] S-malonyltransferase